jgi:hypothetical protein
MDLDCGGVPMAYRNRVVATALVAVLAGWVVVAGRAESTRAGNAQPPARWEYAYVLNSRTQLKTSFNSTSESVQAEDAFRLYRELGGGKRQADFTLADLMSHVGARGWELVSVDTRDAVAATCWFKRVTQ